MAAGYLLRSAVEPPPPPPAGQGMGMRGDGAMRERVAERLDLTPEQADRFFLVVDEHRRLNRRRMNAVRDSMDSVMQAEMAALNARLADILTPGQLDEWRQMSRRGFRDGGPGR